MVIYLLCVVLILTGLYGIAAKKDLLKMVIGLIIMEYSVILFFILIGYQKEGLSSTVKASSSALAAAGLSITVITAAIVLRVYERYGTSDITKIRKLKG